MTLPTGHERCDRPSVSRKRSTTPQPPPVAEEKLLRPAHLPPEGAEPKFPREEAEEWPRRRSSHSSQSPVIARSSSRPKVLVRVLLGFSALSAVALLLFGGHERQEKIAVYREYLRQSRLEELPLELRGRWHLLDSEENFSFVLQEVPISPAMLSDFHDPGDLQRLPFSGEADLDPPQDTVPEQKRLSRFLRAEVPLKLPGTEALEALYLEAPFVTLEVSHPNGTLLLRHRFELLRKVEGALQLPSALCYVLPPGPGPFGAEVFGCEQTAALYASRSQLEQPSRLAVILRSYADPVVVASHLTRGCSRMVSSVSALSSCEGADSCSANVTGAAFSPRPAPAERCFGRPRRLFRVYGLALLGLCSIMAAAAEAILSRGSWKRIRASAFTIFGFMSLAASVHLLYQG